MPPDVTLIERLLGDVEGSAVSVVDSDVLAPWAQALSELIVE